MRGVTGKWGLEVKVNGRDLNLSESTLTSFNLVSNVQQALPSLAVGFKDDTGEFLDNLMSDGMNVTVSVGKPGTQMYSGFNFLISGAPKVSPAGSSNIIEFNAVLNNVGWLRKMVDKPYKGTAAKVIGQLASEVGLQVDIDDSLDDMTWLPNRLPFVGFANHLLQRSFAGDGDALIMAITDMGKLKLKKLSGLIEGGGKVLASNPADGHHILDWAAAPKANSPNASHGYGSTSMGMNLDGTIFEGNDVAVRLMSNATSIMSGIKDTIGQLGMRVNALAPLAGNTHENWYKGIHQNPRVLSTYSFDVETITDIPSNLEVLDSVFFKPINTANGREATHITGKYIVTAITKTIINGRFFEKIVLTSQGQN